MAFNQKEYYKKWYQDHKEHRKEYMHNYTKEHKELNRVRSSITTAKMRERKKQMILNYNIKYLKRHKKFFDWEFHCPKCWRVMMVTQVHNHHIKPEDKLFNISEGVRKSYEELTNELPKTIPICPECHKIITANERGHRMFKKYNSIPSADLAVKLAKHMPHFKRRR